MSDKNNHQETKSVEKSNIRRVAFVSLCFLGMVVLGAAGFALMLFTSSADEGYIHQTASADDSGYVVLFPENAEMLSALDSIDVTAQINAIEPAAGDVTNNDIEITPVALQTTK